MRTHLGKKNRTTWAGNVGYCLPSRDLARKFPAGEAFCAPDFQCLASAETSAAAKILSDRFSPLRIIAARHGNGRLSAANGCLITIVKPKEEASFAVDSSHHAFGNIFSRNDLYPLAIQKTPLSGVCNHLMEAIFQRWIPLIEFSQDCGSDLHSVQWMAACHPQ